MSHLVLESGAQVFASHANEKHAEIYKINSYEEIRKRLAKKMKKEKKKRQEAQVDGDENGTAEVDAEIEITQTPQDEFTRICMLKTKHKIKCVDLFYSKNDSTCLVSVLLSNNMFEIYQLDIKAQINETSATLLHSIELGGHRTDVRTLAFTSDASAMLSASGDSLKIWNRLSAACIRTFKCDYALSSCFLPDDNHVLVACKVIRDYFLKNK